jgi:hypothetical protein
LAARQERIFLATARGLVIAVDIASKRVVWQRTAEQLGIRIRRVSLLDSTTIAVIGDAGQSIILLSAARGDIVARWQVRSSAPVQAMCRAGDNAFIVSIVDTGSSLLYFDSLGALQHRMALPWTGYARAHVMQRQMALASSLGRDECVAALLVGSGLAILRAHGTTRLASYVERFDAPSVRVRISYSDAANRAVESHINENRIAASDLAIAGGRVYVAFGGSSENAGRIIDTYDATTLGYAETWRSKDPVRRLAAAGRLLVVATYDQGTPVIRAYSGVIASP